LRVVVFLPVFLFAPSIENLGGRGLERFAKPRCGTGRDAKSDVPSSISNLKSQISDADGIPIEEVICDVHRLRPVEGSEGGLKLRGLPRPTSS
jgi:hypothetical protein